MTNVLNPLLNITLYSAVLFAAILLFQRLFRRRISAALNYAVWALLILRLIVPVTIDSGYHVFAIPQPQTIQAEQTNMEPTVNDTAAPTVSAPVMQSSEASIVPAQNESDLDTSQYTPSSPQPIDWSTIVVLIWVTGAVGLLTHTAVQRLCLRRKIRHCGTDAPTFVVDMLHTCKKEMNIHTDINVLVQDWLASPALSASLKPTLLLPKHMLQSKQTLEFGIRHELMHFKRKDHIISLLLMALRCVYWFNPIVWLAFRRIQTDMEAACDAQVTSRMSGDERTRYIYMMIDMGNGAKPLYALGMGANQGRKSLEKRVKGIFMAKRTKPTMRMAAGLTAALLFFACFTTACQPTPEEPVVVNKNEGVLKAAVSATPAPTVEYEVPETFTMESFQVGDKLTVNADAQIDFPYTNIFPVYEFVPAEFTQEQVDALINYFYKDQTLYEIEYGWSEAAIEDKISDLEDIYQEILGGATNAAENEKYEMSAEDVQQSIDELNKLLLIAPQINDGQISNGKLKLKSYDNMNRWTLSVTNDLDQKDTRYLLVNSLVENNTSNLMLMNGICYYPNDNAPPNTQAQGIQTTPEQAMKIVKDMLNTCGFDFMEPVVIYAGNATKSDKAQDTGGYRVECLYRSGDVYVTKYATGIPEDASDLSEEELRVAYAYQWIPEELNVYVDDTGISAIEWRGHGEIASILNGSVELLPFEQLDTLIKNSISASYAWDEDTMGSNEYQREINISRIELSMARIQAKDQPENWELVPAFEIYGTITSWNGDNVSTQSYEGYENGYLCGSLITINAIDGSIIDSQTEY